MVFHQKKEWKELNLLYKEFEKFYHEIAVKHGLSDSAFSILYGLCEMGDGCLQRDICDACSLSKQTVNSSIRRLEQDEILFLKRGKGRDMHLHLTDKGQKLALRSVLPVIEMEQAVFDEMGPEESREMVRLTRKYLSLMQKREEAAGTEKY